MEALLFIVPVVLICAIGAWVISNRINAKFAQGLNYVEGELRNANFNISRRVGYYKKTGVASLYLYVDDVNKKWVFASPFDGTIDKIRDFSSLLDWDFFDEDSNTWIDKTTKVMTTGIMGGIGAIAGAALGAPLAGRKGTLFGGAGGALAGAGIAHRANSFTGSYGIFLRTTDTEATADVGHASNL